MVVQPPGSVSLLFLLLLSYSVQNRRGNQVEQRKEKRGNSWARRKTRSRARKRDREIERERWEMEREVKSNLDIPHINQSSELVFLRLRSFSWAMLSSDKGLSVSDWIVFFL